MQSVKGGIYNIGRRMIVILIGVTALFVIVVGMVVVCVKMKR